MNFRSKETNDDKLLSTDTNATEEGGLFQSQQEQEQEHDGVNFHFRVRPIALCALYFDYNVLQAFTDIVRCLRLLYVLSVHCTLCMYSANTSYALSFEGQDIVW